jgi:hypothetical protein
MTASFLVGLGKNASVFPSNNRNLGGASTVAYSAKFANTNPKRNPRLDKKLMGNLPSPPHCWVVFLLSTG